MARPRLLPWLVAGLCLAQSGCFFDRPDPIPQHTITVTPDENRYLYDGQPMSLDQVEAELQVLADKTRRSGTGTARAYLTIVTQPGAVYDRTLALVDWCSSVGLDKIQTTGR